MSRDQNCTRIQEGTAGRVAFLQEPTTKRHRSAVWAPGIDGGQLLTNDEWVDRRLPTSGRNAIRLKPHGDGALVADNHPASLEERRRMLSRVIAPQNLPGAFTSGSYPDPSLEGNEISGWCRHHPILPGIRPTIRKVIIHEEVDRRLPRHVRAGRKGAGAVPACIPETRRAALGAYRTGLVAGGAARSGTWDREVR